GNALMVTLRFDHVTEVCTAFGEKGMAAERVAELVVREVQAYGAASGALGPHLADQWMLPLALAVARSGRAASFTCTELSEHAWTNMDTVSAFLPVHFSTEDASGVSRVQVSPAPQAGMRGQGSSLHLPCAARAVPTPAS
ncbi:MAG TPA: RNA 3'-terminal phosphate cyclase, partial [Ramlibacter sp.]|nr:RNA 3'-terminal phosphate cyclase [Ramlibacter sp.]